MKETKGQLIDRQITIKEKEIALHAETQKLLFDLLSRMTPEQKNRLEGYGINDDYTIYGDISNDSLLVTLYDNTVELILIENLSQIEQKGLVDFILCNNLID